MPRYVCYGLALDSALALPELAHSDGAAVHDGRPARLALGDVPDGLSGAVVTPEGYQVAGGTVLVRSPGTARILVRDGLDIVVEPLSGHRPGWLRLAVLSAAMAILLHQRGLFPLHASAVSAPAGAVGFFGTSGAGKSTLAAALSRRGLPALADDKLLLTPSRSGWLAWPAYPVFHLHEEAAARTGIAARPAPARADKFAHVEPARFAAGPVPLAGLCLIDWAGDGETAALAPLSGTEAFVQLRSHASLGGLVPAMGREAEFLAWAAGLLARVPLTAFRRPHRFAELEPGLDLLERHLRALPPAPET